MSELVGDCRWCRRPIAWDHCAGRWRHAETGSLLCPNGAPAAIDLGRGETTAFGFTVRISR